MLYTIGYFKGVFVGFWVVGDYCDVGWVRFVSVLVLRVTIGSNGEILHGLWAGVLNEHVFGEQQFLSENTPCLGVYNLYYMNHTNR